LYYWWLDIRLSSVYSLRSIVVSMHIELAWSTKKVVVSLGEAINLLCSVPAQHEPLSVITKYFTYSLDVFINIPPKRARNTVAYVSRMCDPTLPMNYERECKCIHPSPSPAILKHSSVGPWGFIRRFIARVLGAFHTNPLTGTNFGAYDSEATACRMSASVQSPVELPVDARLSASHMWYSGTRNDRYTGRYFTNFSFYVPL